MGNGTPFDIFALSLMATALALWAWMKIRKRPMTLQKQIPDTIGIVLYLALLLLVLHFFSGVK
jgi:uncharacterized membrane protein YidH (DUF202 family)